MSPGVLSVMTTRTISAAITQKHDKRQECMNAKTSLPTKHLTRTNLTSTIDRAITDFMMSEKIKAVRATPLDEVLNAEGNFTVVGNSPQIGFVIEDSSRRSAL